MPSKKPDYKKLLEESRESLDAKEKEIQELKDKLANSATERDRIANRPSHGSENITLQGENQNMTVEELHSLLVADIEPLQELRKLHGDEKAAEIITEKREALRVAIRKMLVSVQASTITLNQIGDENDEKMRKALSEYDKKYKPKARVETIAKQEKLSAQEKLIQELKKKHGFSQEEAEEIVYKKKG